MPQQTERYLIGLQPIGQSDNIFLRKILLVLQILPLQRKTDLLRKRLPRKRPEYPDEKTRKRIPQHHPKQTIPDILLVDRISVHQADPPVGYHSGTVSAPCERIRITRRNIKLMISFNKPDPAFCLLRTAPGKKLFMNLRLIGWEGDPELKDVSEKNDVVIRFRDFCKHTEKIPGRSGTLQNMRIGNA